MRPRDIWIAAILGALAPAIPALAEVAIAPGITGQRGTWGSDNNLTVDGHCFGNVSGLPTNGVMSVFSNQATFRTGNLFSTGSLNQSSTSFPDGFMVSNGSTQIASITPAGAVYLRGKCVNSYGCSNTIWEPSKWNDGGTIQSCNNCYNYGNDTRTDSFAQPGCAGGQCPNLATVATIKAGALADGLTWVGDAFPGNTYDCGKGHLIFMAIEPRIDYHWWRLDQTNSLWTHKRGGKAAQNTDDKGLLITNPLDPPNRWGYTEAGGFFCNCGSKANIKGDPRYPQPGCKLSVALAAAAPPSSDSQAAFSVELDAFSGRPNPVFDLTPSEAQALLLRLAGVCDSSTVTPEGGLQDYPTNFLGHSGLTVFRSTPGARANPSAQLSRGKLRVLGLNPPDACRQRTPRNADVDLPDVGQGIEMYLIDTAHGKGVISDLEYSWILKEMHGKW